ncbi:MAG: hypothetical protein JNM67_02780 [Bacteroidetes bacterium]|nr:hypothetical protein [Bacteroidota bacterium]
MKQLNLICLTVLVLVFTFNTNAQNPGKPKMALIEIDTRGLSGLQINLSDMPLTAITKLELEKLGIYAMIDNYDIEYLAKRDSLHLDKCFSTYCISEIANKLKCEKLFTGNISKIGERLVITYKIYDTERKDYEKVIVKEFLNLPQSLPSMIRITLNDMFGLPNNEEEVNTLTKNFLFDEARNNPFKNRLRADGPRMGLTYFTGEAATLIGKPRKDGGFNAMPLMFQFGYQFEKQYLNQGNFQALFEVVPMITGLDQGLFIPSLTLMNGMRNNQNGWEFAFGPSISLTRKSSGFYDEFNNWRLANDTAGMSNKPFIESRIDSRGVWSLHPSFVFALGKTFKSGKLNIPVNAYFVPSNDGYRFGISFGFNSRERYETPSIKN